VLHEIETCKSERAGLDEKILVEMEESEKRNAAVRALGEKLERRRRETTEGKARLDAEGGTWRPGSRSWERSAARWAAPSRRRSWSRS